MAFDFPNTPVSNDEFTQNGVTYIWGGQAWLRKPGGVSTTPPASAYIFNNGLTLQADGVTVDLDPATDLLIGGHIEPPPDGQPYSRQNTGGVITWVPAGTTTRPFVTSISPTVVGTSDPDGTLTVTGANFTNASKIRVGVVPLQTTFVNVNTLTAQYRPATWGMGAHTITVNTSGQSSLPFTFNIINNPTITSISPTSAPAGSAEVTVNIVGTTFTTAAYAPTTFMLDGVDALTNVNTPTTGQTKITPKATPGATTTVQVRDGTVQATTPPVTFTST
jgi:hypothetical protein